jgi:hypothetical protein
MNPILRNRRRSLSALAVLGLLYLGTFGPAAASAADGGPGGGASTAANRTAAETTGPGDVPWAQMSLSVDARISTPAASQAPYDAQVTLDYVIANTGRVPIYRVRLDDPLVPGESVDCDGSAVVEVLPPSSSADCEATVRLPPGTYTSSPQARGWISVLLILGFPVTSNAQTTFTVAAPPPPSSPPASPPASPPPPPPPSPSARPSVSPPAAPPPSPSAPSPSPSATTPAPTTPAPVRTSAPPPSRQPTPAPSRSRRAVALPPQLPTAQVRQLSTHVAVLLLLLPAAVGAAIAGAAAARRR